MEEKRKRDSGEIYFTRDYVVEKGVKYPVFYIYVEDIEDKPIIAIIAKNENGLPEKLYVQSAHFSRGNRYYMCGAVYIDSYNKYYDSAMSALKEGALLEAVKKGDKEEIKTIIQDDFSKKMF